VAQVVARRRRRCALHRKRPPDLASPRFASNGGMHSPGGYSLAAGLIAVVLTGCS
jgi:hypothetical protein